MNPWPGAHTVLGERRIKVHRTLASTLDPEGAAPGQVIALDPEGILVACTEGTLEIQELQESGRKRVDARSFASGRGVCGRRSVFERRARRMKIYTKTGDTGDTGLFGGARVSKASPRVEAYGEVDELNSAVGWARVAVSNADLDELLNQIQNDLFEVGAELGSTEDRKKKSAMPLIAEPQVEALERAIDKYEEGPAGAHVVRPAGRQ